MESTVYAITEKLLLDKVCNNHTNLILYDNNQIIIIHNTFIAYFKMMLM